MHGDHKLHVVMKGGRPGIYISEAWPARQKYELISGAPRLRRDKPDRRKIVLRQDNLLPARLSTTDSNFALIYAAPIVSK